MVSMGTTQSLLLAGVWAALGAPLGAQTSAESEPLAVTVIDDFEGARLDGWHGLAPTGESAAVGRGAGEWADIARITSVRKVLIPTDFSKYTHLQFHLHAPRATDSLITLALDSPDPGTPAKALFHFKFHVSWEGWQAISVPLRAFMVSGKPAGLHRITSIILASNWGNATPAPGTRLLLDELRLVAVPATDPPVIGSMEDDLMLWRGLKPERELVRQGEQAGRWGDLAEIPRLDWCGGLTDWRPFGGLHLWIHSAVANGQQLKIIVWSDSLQTRERDGYSHDLVVDWDGWREFLLDDAAFQTAYQPEGWGKVDGVGIVGGRWGDLQALPDTSLILDDIRVALRDDTEPYVFLDFEEPGRCPEDDHVAVTEEGAHGGDRALQWRPEGAGSLVSLRNVPHDWSSFETLVVMVRTDAPVALPAKVMVSSDHKAVDGWDCYRHDFVIEGSDWAEIRLPIAEFRASGDPLGWDNVQGVHLQLVADAAAPLPADATIYLDDIALVSGAGRITVE